MLDALAMDSQWWLHPHEDQEDFDECPNKNTYEVIQELKDKLDKYDDKFVILAFHHPLYTSGKHNGHYTLKEAIFPLTEVKKNLYIPLPGIGFLYPFYRTAFGAKQDLPHPLYQEFKNEIIHAIGDYDNVIVASGHEHNLQYYVKDEHHYIVSGSGSKSTNLRKEKDAVFASKENGFAKISFYKDGSAVLEFHTVVNSPKVAFSKEIIVKPLEAPEDIDTYQLSSEMISDKASESYNTSGFHRSFFGQTYRKDWNTEISVRNLNLSTEHGGLRPIKKGGGFSSNSLRLQAADKKQYVLRSVQKGVVKVVPPLFRGTFVQSIFQDQISASQPYAALAVPPLAEAAGVYHTNPEFIYLEKQEALGDFNDGFANAMYLYEERPAGDSEDEETLGGSRKIVGYSKVLKALRKDHEALINQEQVLRSRLFDIYLGDWDRHDDQWRWASFEEERHGETHTFYEPIPRDRDQVFFGYKGIVPSLTKLLSPELRKFVYFDHTIGNVKYLGFNARHFDRHFLNRMTKENWINTAKDLQKNITNEAIKASINALPEPIRKLRQDEYSSKLIQRRSDLVKYTSEMYNYLAKYVDIPGTDKRELFEVTRNADNTTDVNVYNLNKRNEKIDLFYSRKINSDETKEIRLYGLGADDQFRISGTQDKGSLIRIIGGKGDDVIDDQSKVKGGKKKTIVFDNELGKESKLGSEAKFHPIHTPSENDYDRKDYYYDANVNIPLFAFNPDDGFVVSNSYSINKYGWRKRPYKSSHQLLTTYAFGSRDFEINYSSEFIEAIGHADFLFELTASIPSDRDNFFALSNDRAFPISSIVDFDFLRYTQTHVEVSPAVQFSSENRLHKFTIAAYYEYANLTENADKRISELPLFALEQESNHYIGLRLNYSIFKIDDPIYTTSGLDLKITPSLNVNLANSDQSFFGLQGHLTAYNFIPLPRPLVWATRIAGGVNYGDFSFYQAHYLGRNTVFRGFRENRVGGKSSFVWSNDLRLKLFKIPGKVLPFTFGVIGAYDHGRVWNKDQESVEGWHSSYGGGFWISPFDVANMSFYFMSVPADDEFDFKESTFSFRFGFAF